MASTHSTAVERLLREAGWHPGRRVPAHVARWRKSLETGGGFMLHGAAELVLLEYGGLAIGKVGVGVNMAHSDINLDPLLAIGEEDRFLDRFPETSGQSLFPLGEVHRGHAFLGIGSGGDVFLLMDEVFDHWPTFDAALEALLPGIG